MVKMYLGYMSSVLTSIICEGLALQIKLQKDLVACLSSFLLVVMSLDDGFLWHVCQWCKNSAASLPQKLCEALVTTPPCSAILVQQTIVILTGRNDVVVCK